MLYQRFYRLAQPDGDGLNPYLNEHGAFLGEGSKLFNCDTSGRFTVRPLSELEPLLKVGYGNDFDVEARMGGLALAARHMNEFEGAASLAKAQIALLLTGFPALPSRTHAKAMMKMDRLGKYPGQPRKPAGEPDGGQFSGGGRLFGGGGASEDWSNPERAKPLRPANSYRAPSSLGAAPISRPSVTPAPSVQNTPVSARSNQTRPIASRQPRHPAPISLTHWPVPGQRNINIADKPKEGDGHFDAPRPGRRHAGIDIQAPVGSSVVSAADGVVVRVGYNNSYGRQIVIDHGGGIYTQYAHLNRQDVAVGQHVRGGDEIGAVGQTGNSPKTGDAHLHFEVRIGSARARSRGGTVIDPLSILPVER